jgi:hypothetical protein
MLKLSYSPKPISILRGISIEASFFRYIIEGGEDRCKAIQI